MKHLHLLRHAKSSWDDPDLPDHERPLAPRGKKAIRRIADYVRVEGIAPDLVLCSTALRARQTLDGLLPVLGGDVDVRVEEGLYGASVDELLGRLRAVDDTIGSVLVVAHNPTLHGLALTLTNRGDLLERFPTGALASITFTTAWEELGGGAAELLGVFFPRTPRAPS